MNDNDNLTLAQQMLVAKAVENCRRFGSRATVKDDSGEAYAYPDRDGIAWGFNSGETGVCIARGVVEG